MNILTAQKRYFCFQKVGAHATGKVFFPLEPVCNLTARA